VTDGMLAARSVDMFPMGVMARSVDRAKNFDESKAGAPVYAFDDETGMPVWTVTGVDVRALMQVGEDEKPFRGEAQVRVRVVAEEEPRLPGSSNGLGPVIEFEGLEVKPWVNRDKCRGRGGCGAQQAFSFKATGVRPFRG
jgi:hypothetical protein